MTNNNRNLNPQTQIVLDQLKMETAAELGLQYGADISSRDNGKIGGEMVKKLVKLGELKLAEMVQEQGMGNVELSYYLNNSNSQPQPQNNNQLH